MIKKLLVVIFAILCLSSVKVANSQPIFKGYADSFELYLGGQKSGVEIVRASINLFPFIHNVCGESFKMEAANFNLETFFKQFNAQILFIEEISEGICYYAYSPKIKYRQQVLGEIVNLHVFVGKQITVGSPIIYGSF